MNATTSLEKITVSPPKTPLASVIWLHGLGADGHDFSDLVPQLHLPDDCPIRFIFPHAPIRPVTINANMRMRAWYDIYSLSDIEKEDEQCIQQMQRSIENLIEQEIQNGISHDRIILAGFSQGGAMALYVGLRYSKSLAGILALSAYLPLPHRLEKEKADANKNIPIFMAHGKSDPVLPLILGHRTYVFLKQQHYPVLWHEYPMAHQVCLEEINDIRQWLIQRLSQA